MYGFWAEKWLKKEYSEEELDPTLLMWAIRRNLKEAVRSETLELEGDRQDVRNFSQWSTLNFFAKKAA